VSGSGNRRNAKKLTVCSCHKPHPEAVDAADTGAGKWTADGPDDEGLVTLAGGTAVPWAKGRTGRGNEQRGVRRCIAEDPFARRYNSDSQMEIPELLALEFQAEVSCAS
jgi:hypothetical protein